jgi:CRISPR type I-E-associated protein CasB/Cse2
VASRHHDSLALAVAAIANEIAGTATAGGERRGLSPGDLAALRRGDGGPAFYRIAVRHLEPRDLLPAPGAARRDEREEQWIAILQGMAAMDGLHRPGVRLGNALAARDAARRPRVSEARVLRLLAAEGEALRVVLRGVVRQLATAGQAADWTDLAELLLTDPESRRGRHVRRAVAFDYYRMADKEEP